MSQTTRSESQSQSRPAIVIVDDEEDSRDILGGVLRQAGHRVQLFPSGLHAQQVLEFEQVAIVIAEENLPGIGGMRLLSVVRDRWPWMRRVLMTEKPSGDLIMRAKVQLDARILVKPVKPSALVRVVEEELEAYDAEQTRPTRPRR